MKVSEEENIYVKVVRLEGEIKILKLDMEMLSKCLTLLADYADELHEQVSKMAIIHGIDPKSGRTPMDAARDAVRSVK